MTRTISIIILLTIVGLWVLIEARYPDESPRHRHRHRHESHKLSTGRKSDWKDEAEDDWEDETDENETKTKVVNEENTEDYYRARNYQQARLEPRHRTRFHVNSRHASNPWQKVEDLEQRRRNVRFGINRGHKTRLWTYPGRNHDLEADDSTEDIDYDDYDSPRQYREDDRDQERSWRTFHRRSDYPHGQYRNWLHSRRDWMRKTAQDRRRKVNHYYESRTRFPFANYDDYNDDEDDWDVDSWTRDRFRKSNSTDSAPEDVDDSLREADDDDDDDEYDNEEVLDNDFFKEDDPPYKTYDDIIKRLTSDDPTTKSSSVKRGYRNIENEKQIKRDSNAKNLLKNTVKVNSARYSIPMADQKLSNVISSVDQRPMDKKKDFTRSRTSAEVDDDDDYLNSDDKAADIQADVTNGYADDESSTEDETSAPLPVTTTSTTTTSTTTTTARPAITTQAYDRRDSRLYNATGSYHNTLSSIHHSRNAPKNQHHQSKNGKSAEIREALQHAIKVSREGSCQWPRVRVIPVKDVYPSPVTTYIPHCAILHRCSDDTGCCRSETHTCVPKQSHKIELSFYTTSYRGVSVVEKLSFYNHTECECREKSEYGMTSDSKISGQEGNEYRSLGTTRQQQQQQHQSVMPPQNMRRPPQKKPCKCPFKFKPRITLEGVCECYCSDNNQDCINLRRGIGQITLQEEVCIENNECTAPPCDFGTFIHTQRRCPRKKERFHAISSYPNHMHHHPRLRNQR